MKKQKKEGSPRIMPCSCQVMKSGCMPNAFLRRKQHRIMKPSILLIPFLVVLFSMPVVKASVSVTDCLNLSVSNQVYVLTTDLINKTGIYDPDTARFYCIKFSANNITFDCQNHLITGNCEYGHHGILLRANGSILKNCFLSQWHLALANRESHNFISNIRILSAEDFIIAFGGEDNTYDRITVDDNTLNCGGGYTGFVYFESIHDVIKNSRFNNLVGTSYGFDLYGTATSIYNNTFDVDSIHLYSYLFPNNISAVLFYNNLVNGTGFNIENNVLFNATNHSGIRVFSNGSNIGGNFWTNPTVTGYSDECTDTAGGGFCDDPYPLDGHTDYLPYSIHYVAPPTPPVPAPPVASCHVCDPTVAPSGVIQSFFRLGCLLLDMLTCNTILFIMIVGLILVYGIYRYIRSGGG
jgi:hypothetical protein